MTSTPSPNTAAHPARARLFALGAAIFLAACGQDAGIVSEPRTTEVPTSLMPSVPVEQVVEERELISMQVHPIDELIVDPASATITARFEAALGDCTGYRIGAETIGDEVVVTLLQGLHPNAAAMTCPAGIETRELTIELAEPVGDRLVRATPAAGPTEEDGPVDEEQPADHDPSAGGVLDPADFVGLSYADAIENAELDGWRTRLVRDGDEHFPATRDFRPDRLNFEIDDDVVTRVFPG